MVISVVIGNLFHFVKYFLNIQLFIKVGFYNNEYYTVELANEIYDFDLQSKSD